ncbi:MAG: peptidoglycan DD-metalloendopeptidase family protein [Deltaproteobacteria bacterium]|nr:peptidoglycan DD-metalloendopeptidase family protein [Deltaproteobacteria bacterium]
MLRTPAALAFVAATLAAPLGAMPGCATTYHYPSDEASSVEYEMVSPPGAVVGGMSAVPAPSRTPSTLTATVVSERHGPQGGSVVRVVPIAEYRARAAVSPADEGRADDLDVEPPSEAPTARDERPDAGDGPGTPIDGLMKPYSTRRIFRGFGACRGNRHYHEAIDMGGVGPDSGVGTPIRSMQRARVTFIGRSEDDPAEFGVPDRRSGTATRGGREIPRSAVIEGYGKVYFFTKNKGRWRSGTVVITEGLGGPLGGHEIRYMHLAAVKPGLKVGDVLEMGDELGLLGGTGVQQSAPHLHLDIQDPDGQRVDVAPLLGLPPTAADCAGTVVAAARAAADPAVRRRDDHDDEHEAPATTKVVEAKVWAKAITTPACGEPWTREEDFTSGKYYAHDVKLTLEKGESVAVELARKGGGSWSPRIEVLAVDGAPLYSGTAGTRTGRQRGIVVARTKGGIRSAAAGATITAKKGGEAIIRVTAWPDEHRGRLLPQDGRYAMSVARRCKSSK